MKNNKLTRKRAARLAALQSQPDQTVAGTLDNGTEVLKSRESRAKVRRWSFEADVEIVMPVKKEGEEPTSITLPKRTMKLDSITYCTAREAIVDCEEHKKQLRSTNAMFANSVIRVRAIPHETVSNVTVNQLKGYRDMAMILDKALGMAIADAAQVVTGQSVGGQFLEAAAVEAAEGIEAKPARTNESIKEEFYRRAVDDIKKAMNEQAEGANNSNGVIASSGDTQSPTIELTDGGAEERGSFVPEIIEIDRSSGLSSSNGAEEAPAQG